MRKGTILITVLVIISVCTTLALFINEKSISSFSSVNNLHYEYQGAIYVMTAMVALETVFKYDDTASDGAEDIWNLIPPIPVENGFLTAYIHPLNARFPVNALSIKDEEGRKRFVDGFNKLVARLEIDTGSVDDLMNWLGSGYVSSLRLDENNAPYNIKGNIMNTLAELAYIPNFENNYKQLSKHLSIGESNYKINLNLASEDVILSLVPELEPYIADILEARSKEDFKDVSAIYKIMGDHAQEEYNAILPYIDVKSSMFYVKMELNIGDTFKFYHILFQRSGKSIKAIKYIEGANIDYF